ncbi:MAG TPA: sigma-70 family RNA polymerase sigma factor [Verrucomicrobiae bacterium]|nr:sigma-70 family RNA polymerase sigma factor [Verrucomicrobiae bacterium]
MPAAFPTSPEAAEEFKDLVWLAREQGCLTSIDIGDALAERGVKPEEMEAIRFKIQKLEVKIVDPGELEGDKEADKAREAAPKSKHRDRADASGDPVRIYFQQMSRFPMLTNEQEREIFRRMEQVTRDIRKNMYKFGFMAGEHVAIAERLLAQPPRERIDRVMLDTKVEAREETLAMLGKLVKQVRKLDAEADWIFGEWQEASGPERGKFSEAFEKVNSRIEESLEKFCFNQKVLVDMAALAERIRQRVASGKNGNGPGENGELPPDKMTTGPRRRGGMQEFLRMGTGEYVRACGLLQSQVAALQRLRNQVVEANLRLVIAIAKRHLYRGVSLLDLVQDGNIGLVKAVEKFQYKRGVRFSSYAGWWIRHHIGRSVMDHARTIRIPAAMGGVINQLMHVEKRLMQIFGRSPSPEEMADEMKMPVARVEHLLRMAQPPLSLHSPLSEDEDCKLGDAIEDHTIQNPLEAATSSQLKDELVEMVANLTERQRTVLELRFGLIDGQTRTLEEIGQQLKITRERVRQIEVSALKRMRHPARARCLEDLPASGTAPRRAAGVGICTRKPKKIS